MSKSNAFENAWLLHVFNNAGIANIGDATGLRGSVTAGSLYVSLHTADPGEAGDQSTSEVAYTGYARVPAARSALGWTVTGNSVSPTSNIDFGQRTNSGAGITVTFFGVGTSSSGAGMLLYSGTVTGMPDIVQNSIPRLTTASTITED